MAWTFLAMCVRAHAVRAPSAPGWRTPTPDADRAGTTTSSPSPATGMPARYSPVGFSTAAGDASGLRRTELPGCHLHLFRHVSKAAGTTVRFIFDKQVAMGEWEFSPMCHYGFREADWKETLRRFRDAAVDPANVRDGTGPRVLVEARNEWGASEAFERVILRDLKETRAELEALGCGVTTSLLFREPEAQYRSFWNYYIAKLRDDPDETDPGKGPEAWGDTFQEWAALVPDLQLRELLGDRCTPKLREPVFAAETREEDGDAGKKTARVRLAARRLPETCKVSLGDRARFESMLAQVDVVGTTDRFDLFLLQLADATGIQHLEYSPSNAGREEKTGKSSRDGKDGNATTGDSMRDATVNDRWAYDLVAATRDARVAAEDAAETRRETCGGDESAECGLLAREKIFASLARTSGERTLSGGASPSSVFMFANADASRAGGAAVAAPGDWVRPDFYVSPPVCKGFGTEFAGLVFRNDTRFRCDRGCSFDVSRGENARSR